MKRPAGQAGKEQALREVVPSLVTAALQGASQQSINLDCLLALATPAAGLRSAVLVQLSSAAVAALSSKPSQPAAAAAHLAIGILSEQVPAALAGLSMWSPSALHARP